MEKSQPAPYMVTNERSGATEDIYRETSMQLDNTRGESQEDQQHRDNNSPESKTARFVQI